MKKEKRKIEDKILALPTEKECSHKFVYAFKEQIADYMGNYHYKDVVICEKCGLIKRFDL